MKLPLIIEDVESVETWYESRVRPFLASLEKIDSIVRRLEDFDADLKRLREAREKYNDELVVCFLGAAGVGKSTLINALVDGRQSILPSGGIGPLTAQALSVRAGTPPHLEVKYHGPGEIWKLTMALEWSYKDDLKQTLKVVQPTMDEIEAIEAEDRKELQEIAVSGESFDQERVTAYRKQAQLLVKGNQNRDARPGYLIDCLRLALRKERIHATVPDPDDQERIQRIISALATKEFHLEGSVSEREFRQSLHDHASGFLAPLIREMSVTCESGTLPQGVVLVDLPGIGVASDIFNEITGRWIREKARAVTLVVNHRGVHEVEAQLLHQSGFLNKLLYSIGRNYRIPSPL